MLGRDVQIRLAKRDKNAEDTSGRTLETFERIVEITQDAVVTSAVTIGTLYAASRVVRTVCNVIETAAKAKF